MFFRVQKKSTPFKNPKNNGGSPKGVREPPALDTMKIKNTTTWATCLRLSLALMSGRIMSMDAPVVPMKLAKNAPIARMAVLRPGLPCKLPRIKMPPETVYKAVKRTMNGMYYANSAWTKFSPAKLAPNMRVKGMKNAKDHAATTLP